MSTRIIEYKRIPTPGWSDQQGGSESFNHLNFQHPHPTNGKEDTSTYFDLNVTPEGGSYEIDYDETQQGTFTEGEVLIFPQADLMVRATTIEQAQINDFPTITTEKYFNGEIKVLLQIGQIESTREVTQLIDLPKFRIIHIKRFSPSLIS